MWWVVLIYVLALVALGHAPLARRLERHPDARLGRHAARRAAAPRRSATVIALVTAVGFALPPLAILFGIVKGS